MAKKTKVVTFNSLEAVVEAIEKKRKTVLKLDSEYRQAVLELTGHDPTTPIQPMDVVKIVATVFDKRYAKNVD